MCLLCEVERMNDAFLAVVVACVSATGAAVAVLVAVLNPNRLVAFFMALSAGRASVKRRGVSSFSLSKA
eukprot:CAMPEP_0182475598 /NCGR_PEP_ID=MMETSP1319-20130603/27644_1 /TAXON_ID=172717 /ORGANISM="Bolidomonas pacifica, Strain RCC208" /LENGTH=68 /DNA_ID=CAMNT_0024676605 /DNA_START=190 /DNA_END=396 /DNA_ORIENTATION=+